MDINYLEGFRDAVDMFTAETDRIVQRIYDTDERMEVSLNQAVDSFVATTYVMKFFANQYEDDYVEQLEEQYEEEFSDNINAEELLVEELLNNKEAI